MFGWFGKKDNTPAPPPPPPAPEPTVHRLNIPSSFWLDILSDDRKKIIYTQTSDYPGKNNTEVTLAYGDIPLVAKLEYDGDPKGVVKYALEGPNFKVNGTYLIEQAPQDKQTAFMVGKHKCVCMNPNGSIIIKSRWAGEKYDEAALEELSTLRLLAE